MNVKDIVKMKNKEKITMLTCYDYLTAKILQECNIDIILVGDSLGTTVLGFETTIPVTLEDIIRHTEAVKRGAPNIPVIADMPFLSYGHSIEESIKNAGYCMKYGNANGVKLEGGKNISDLIKRIVDIGIPVMGHIGLKPQSVNLYGYRTFGKDEREREELLSDALELEKAGIFALVLEYVESETAKLITKELKIPVIGIGSGKFTDGQVLVITDMLGYEENKNYKHNKLYAKLHPVIAEAVKSYIFEVKQGLFPDN